MVLLILFTSLLLLLISAATQAAITTSTTPPYTDDWCEQNCNSLNSCNELYQSNSIGLRLRVRFPIDNVGSHLIQDKYLVTTVSRQSFETQFILDLANATNTSPCRLYVLDVFPEGTDNYWDNESVFISFRLFPADASFIAELTRQIQQPNSALYDGHVTHATDSLYGLVIPQWDHSLKLLYSTQLVGDSNVIDDSEHGRYLNQGSLQTCTASDYSTHLVNNTYCKFEKYLIQDMERASLDLQSGQFVVLFIKEADRHSVIVSFRLIPEVSMNNTGQDIAWVESKVTMLIAQIADSESLLYSGNVSFKIDPTWGISGKSKQTRQFSKYLSQPAPPTSTDAYERCKATNRCPRAWIDYNQSLAVSSYTFQEYLNGEHVQANAFLDFEDWRVGIRGWEQSCRNDGGNSELCLPASPEESNANNNKPTGAHWSPFIFDALGPTVQASGNKWNKGLVLNGQKLNTDISDQTDVINQYESLVAWLDEEYQYGVTGDVMLRSREEIRANITNYTEIIQAEKQVLEALTQSQCSNVQCSLLFNTSDATLSGVIIATGAITTTPDGTEVALWAFDSIDLDEHVNITLTGQRAMALVSRSSVRINTTLHAVPGTLGGFPGVSVSSIRVLISCAYLPTTLNTNHLSFILHRDSRLHAMNVSIEYAMKELTHASF